MRTWDLSSPTENLEMPVAVAHSNFLRYVGKKDGGCMFRVAVQVFNGENARVFRDPSSVHQIGYTSFERLQWRSNPSKFAYWRTPSVGRGFRAPFSRMQKAPTFPMSSLGSNRTWARRCHTKVLFLGMICNRGPFPTFARGVFLKASFPIPDI